MVDSFVQVNIPSSLGKKFKTFTSVDGDGNIVESESATLVDPAGNVIPIATDLTLLTRASETTLAAIAALLATGALKSAPPSSTGTLTQVSASLTSGPLLADNAVRIGFSVRNTSLVGTLYLLENSAGGVASPTNHTVAIVPGGYYEDPFRYAGEVVGVWDALLPGDLALINEYVPV